jgi:hypothetical protein
MLRGLLFLSLLLLPTAAACATGFPASYSAQPIRGWVVDASTGQPLEGVIVVAQWILYETSVGGQNPHKRLEVLETVTGSDGGYAFPGWGPKPNLPPIIGPGYGCCFLTNRDPQLSFFKTGYRTLRLLNRGSSDSSMRTSQWDGKTIELEPFKGSPKEWARQLNFLQGDLGWEDLDWRTCPRMVLAIEEERLRSGFSPSEVSSIRSLGTSIEEVRGALRKQP